MFGSSSSNMQQQALNEENAMSFVRYLDHQIQTKTDISTLIENHIDSTKDITLVLDRVHKLLVEKHQRVYQQQKISPELTQYTTASDCFRLLQALFEQRHTLTLITALENTGHNNSVIPLLKNEFLTNYQRYYLLQTLNIASISNTPINSGQTTTLKETLAEKTKDELKEICQQLENKAPILSTIKNDIEQTRDSIFSLNEYDPSKWPRLYRLNHTMKTLQETKLQQERCPLVLAERFLFITTCEQYKEILQNKDLQNLKLRTAYHTAIKTLSESSSQQDAFDKVFKKLSRHQIAQIIRAYIQSNYGNNPLMENKLVPSTLVEHLNKIIKTNNVTKESLNRLLTHNMNYAYKAFSEPNHRFVEFGTMVLGFCTIGAATPWIVTWAYTTYYGMSLTFAAVPPLMLLGIVILAGAIAAIGLWTIRFYEKKKGMSLKLHKHKAREEMKPDHPHISIPKQEKKIDLQQVLAQPPHQENQTKPSPIHLKGDIFHQELLTEFLLTESLRVVYHHTNYRKELDEFLTKEILDKLPKSSLSDVATINKYFAYNFLEKILIQLHSNGHKVYKTIGRRFVEACVFIIGMPSGWGGLHFTALIIAVATNSVFTVFGLNPIVFGVSLTLSTLFCGYMMHAYFNRLLKFKPDIHSLKKNPYLYSFNLPVTRSEVLKLADEFPQESLQYQQPQLPTSGCTTNHVHTQSTLPTRYSPTAPFYEDNATQPLLQSK